MDSNINRAVKRTIPYLPSILLAGLVVLMASCHFIVPPQGWSKKWGPLVPHKTFPGNCSLCHVPESWSVLKEDFTFDHAKQTGYALEGAHAGAACLRCHNDRGPVEAYVARGCSGCHVDPHAGSLGLSCEKCHSQMNWRPQGLVAEHANTRFPLVGMHAVAACESCHERAPVNFYMGAPTDCFSCHQKDYNSAPGHLSSKYSTECQQCHSQGGWDQANFNHDFFPLNGEHSGLSCKDCHTSGKFEPISSDCNSCHGNDFQSAPDHVAAGFPTDCQQCHADTGWDQVSFIHSASFPLTAGHSEPSCAQCHTSGNLGTVPADCFSCHQANYQSAPSHVASGFSQDCLQCHTTSGWDGATIDHSFFPLTAGHGGLDCTQCHLSENYQAVSPDCASCHDDKFQSAPDHVAAGFPTDCQQCHTVNGWAPASFIHPASFPLTAGHSGPSCVQCHSSGGLGTIPSDCYSCHQSNYQSAPSHVANSWTDCQQCHTTTGWDLANFNHGFFPLNGGHNGLDCAQCHIPDNYQSLSPDCSSCHDEKFQSAPDHVAAGFPTDCQQCHNVNGWTPSSFVHPASFPLTAGHSGPSCVQCHSSGGLGTIPSDCYSCHQSNYQSAPSHVANSWTDCQQCHTTTGWDLANFNHSFFPLNGGHNGLDCAQCHVPGNYQSLTPDCNSCHGDKFQTAPDHVAAGFQTDCQRCHTVNGWSPSSFMHTGTFPLTAGHSGSSCAQCHTSGSLGSVPSDCNSCHQANYQGAPDHVAAGFPTDCQQCHTVNGWSPSSFMHTGTFPLTAGHSGPSCAQCHTSGSLGSVPSDCNSCHQANYQTAPDHVAAGFPTDCQQCHTVNGWAPSSFVHTSTFPLTAGHNGPSCAQCHTSGNLGSVPSDCYSCHQANYQSAPSHVASGFSQDCLQCHTVSGWTPSSFVHTGTFPLTAGHSGPSCVQCHTTGNLGSVPADCYSCHQSNYQSAPNHVASGFPQNCLQCHTTSGWDQAIVDHSFFPLTAGHGGLDCVQCHTSGSVGTIPSDCYSCHQSNYQSAPSHAVSGFPLDCLQCHTTSGWTGATIDHSFFPLTAGHSGLDCAQCHKSGSLGTIPSDCYSCHQSNYQSAPNHVSSGFSHDCLGCHTTTTWLGATFTHAFPLTGNHNLSCTTCHLGGSTSTFTCLNTCHSKSNTDSHHSDVRNYAYDSAACYNCHPNGRH